VVAQNVDKPLFQSLFDLSGQTVLVTGGSRGLGLDIARAAAELGANIILVARSEQGLELARASINIPADRIATLAADIGQLDAIPSLVEQAIACFGPIDVLVNNAGINHPSPAIEYAVPDWHRVMDVNLNAPVFLAGAVAKTCMIPRRRGKILNIASIGGLIGNAPQFGIRVAAYNASKGGLISVTRALGSEWGQHNINVNALCPGFFITEMSREYLEHFGPMVLPTIPLGRFGGEHDLIGPAMLLMTEAGRHITGETLVVDGGMISAS
jgi:NAD(P)-dependent dehydrogenase (short-subunit alcohol dehydrogenase family)